MRPDESNNSRGGALDSKALSQQAAAQILRGQINSIYDNTNPETPQPTAKTETNNPHNRTHSNQPQTQPEQWAKYHTAWQNYYQKYYEGYYSHYLHQQQHSPENKTTSANIGYFNEQSSDETGQNRKISKKEAIAELRQKLIVKTQESATKFRKSHHFMPITAGVVVVLLFLFLQYNQIIISNIVAYVSPGNINIQNIIIDPSSDVVVNSEPRLIIPKINVDVPVFYDISSDYDSQMTAMTKGVAHFAIPGASSHPGQVGNTVLAGHSSSELFDSGNYKFIFVQLDKLVKGDVVYANYNSKRYTYVVTKKVVVDPTDISSLIYPTTKPILTLLTCVPIGTAKSRLLVTAEQVSPDPNSSTVAPATNNKLTVKSIPSSSQSFFEWLFGKKY
jgi:sortase A